MDPSHFQDAETGEEWPEKRSTTTDIAGGLRSHLLTSGLTRVEKIAIQNQNTGSFQ